MVEFRRATGADAAAIALVQLRAWRAAYRELLPAWFLDGLGERSLTAEWTHNLAMARPEDAVLVAELGGAVVGFAVAGPAAADDGEDDGEDGRVGELFELDVDPGHWGHGTGRALLAAATAALAAVGLAEAVLWVLPGNARARRMYEAAGWVADGGERDVQVMGVVVAAQRYRLAALA
jgi:ribosomal protein S18 acetylase RimI-like enzyme